MDFLPTLPPDLMALADPSVRGAAQLLAPMDPGHAEALGATPFALCLALLTAPPPSGEALPSTGNDLPTPPLEVAADSAPSIADLMATLAPVAAAVQAQLRPVELPPGTVPTDAALPAPVVSVDASAAAASPAAFTVTPQTLAAAPLEATPAFARPSLPAAEPAPVAAGAQPPTATPLGLTPQAPIDASATADAAVAYETADPLVPEGVAKTLAEGDRFDGGAADDRKFERAAQRPEPRASIAPASPQPAAVPQYQAVAAAATPSAEVGAVMQSAARRAELQKVLLPTGVSADGGSVAQTGWLPAAVTTGNTSQGITAPPQAVPGAPVDTRSPTWHEAFASRVQWLVDTQVGEAHIKLNPPELGAVDVKISLVDDKTFVQLTAATAAARDELSQSLPKLRELFTTSGLELGGASVHNGRDGQQSAYGQGQDQGAGTHAPEQRWVSPFSAGADELPMGSLRAAQGRIDIFA